MTRELSPAYYDITEDGTLLLNDKWTSILNEAYTEPQRYYHTLAHIQSMLDALAENEHQLDASLDHPLLTRDNRMILGLAIWFHDAVYSVTTTTPGYNEIESALLFDTYAREMQLVPILARFQHSHKEYEISIGVKYLILCTLTHEMHPNFPSSVPVYQENSKVQSLIDLVSRKDLRPKEILIALFLDMDISILGASAEKYNTYAKQIRREYSAYSWDAYRQGRSKIMTSFLQRNQIFFTNHFHQKYEQQARRNIQRELNSLQNGDENVYPSI